MYNDTDDVPNFNKDTNPVITLHYLPRHLRLFLFSISVPESPCCHESFTLPRVSADHHETEKYQQDSN